MTSQLPFYEFFAGGGMARAGLGSHWTCAFANDLNPMKVATYRANWGDDHLVCGDVASLNSRDLPGEASLVWASFPCQDLSLAGMNRGLGSAASNQRTRSGTFWPFWKLMQDLSAEGRGPRLVVLENVCGTLTSHGGRDFEALATALASSNYRFGAVVLDARHFVPQSRPRLFIIGVRGDLEIPEELCAGCPTPVWHPQNLVSAVNRLSKEIRASWVWWNIPPPSTKSRSLADLIEAEPVGVRWHSEVETRRLLSMMTEVHAAKLRTVQALKVRTVGTVYRRTRTDPTGEKRQRIEVRFDGLAGCLRTPAGGSSRQTILVVHGGTVRSRLLSAREAARLMGLSDKYKLPGRYNDAYHVAGDGVCVPVVRHLARTLLEPLVGRNERAREPAAAA